MLDASSRNGLESTPDEPRRYCAGMSEFASMLATLRSNSNVP
jgi:hypothetical protein